MNKIKDNIVVVFSSHLGKEKNDNFTEHIHKTIGSKHKVICYENYNEFSLAELYNKAITEYSSPNNIMVFCHPDIIIRTQNWGKVLLNHFKYSNYGILGLAGTIYLSETGRWWEKPDAMYGIVQHTNGFDTWTSTYSNPINGIQETITIDGVFMAIDCNEIVHKFDENFGKFHFYDLGFCVPNYLDGVNVGVITTIRILHESIGNVNEEWEKNRVKFSELYKDELPITMSPIYKNLNMSIPKQPKVSVIIPTKNNLEYLVNNLMSWHDIVKYENYEIIIADTGSDPDVIKEYGKITNKKIRLIKYDYYHFAKINNDVVKNHVSEDTELILFCNDDIKLLNDALSRCVQVYQTNSNVGTIGIRLHFGDSSVQHCGIILYRDENDKFYITHKDFKRSKDYSTNVVYNIIGNTGAFMLINKNLFVELGYFNETYKECFEDVELNINCVLNKKKNITVCDAVAFHYESVSRRKDTEKGKKEVEDLNQRFIPFYLQHKDKIKSKIPLIDSKSLQPVR